jgi:hypothetical protein
MSVVNGSTYQSGSSVRMGPVLRGQQLSVSAADLSCGCIFGDDFLRKKNRYSYTAISLTKSNILFVPKVIASECLDAQCMACLAHENINLYQDDIELLLRREQLIRTKLVDPIIRARQVQDLQLHQRQTVDRLSMAQYGSNLGTEGSRQQKSNAIMSAANDNGNTGSSSGSIGVSSQSSNKTRNARSNKLIPLLIAASGSRGDTRISHVRMSPLTIDEVDSKAAGISKDLSSPSSSSPSLSPSKPTPKSPNSRALSHVQDCRYQSPATAEKVGSPNAGLQRSPLMQSRRNLHSGLVLPKLPHVGSLDGTSS